MRPRPRKTSEAIQGLTFSLGRITAHAMIRSKAQLHAHSNVATGYNGLCADTFLSVIDKVFI